MRGVVWLSEIRDEDKERVGTKAFTLAALGRQGLPVPDGFVLPADVPVDEALSAYARLGGAVAVRSSSSAEDLEGSSFAGQYKTVLGVQGAAALASAVRECRESEAAASAYAELVGASRGRLAVLVQRMVPARAAGVVFTRHPRDEGRLLVEAHEGSGDAVVAGSAAPDRYVVDRGTRARVAGPERGCLGPADLAAVSALALRAETLAGAPRDVEWALGPDGPALLQSRPITVEAEDAPDPRVRRLTRANVGEVLPDPVTPLTWSTVGAFLERAFRDVARAAGLLPREAPPFLVLYRRRLYLNLSLCVDVAAGLPGVSPDAAEALLLGGGSGAGALPSPSVSALGVLARLVVLGARLPARVEAAARAVDALSAAPAGDPADEHGLVERLDRFAATGYGVAGAHVAVSGSCGFRLALLARLLDRFRPGATAERVNRLLAGLPDVPSVAPALAMEALAAEAARRPSWLAWLRAGPSPLAAAPADLGERLRAFLDLFGHRSVAEGELLSSAWEDDPEAPLRALRALAETREDASSRRRAAAAATRDADEEALLAGAGLFARPLLRWALEGARNSVRERERTKELSVRLVHYGRRAARAAGRRLVARGRILREDDVFFLTIGELRRALLGEAPSRALVARRRRRHEREGSLDAPREVDLEGPAAAGVPSLAWRGTGVSAGVGAGPARVLLPGEPLRLEAGEVLVAPVLDAAYGPLLAASAGAAAEIGGLLSHGAVVARELGVPCVVDVRGITANVRNGEPLVVDGGSGLVARADASDEARAAASVGSVLPALVPEDTSREALHPLEASPLARESVYLNVQDAESGLSLVASAGIRAGGRGEALVALRSGDGPLLFGLVLDRPDVGEGFGVGGVRIDWNPFRLRIGMRLAPWDPDSFPPSPLPLLCAPRTVDVSLALTLEPTTPAIDFCRGLPDDVREALAPLGAHHIEQSGNWRGFLETDGERRAVRGTGSRDHSWGRRSWDAADHWRLFTARLLPREGGDELSFHALAVSVRGRRIEGGFLTRGGSTERITRVLFAPDSPPGFPLRTFALEIVTERAFRLRLVGTVARTLTVPVDVERRFLRHLAGRPYRLLLHENFTRFEGESHAGDGMAETTQRPS
jgi:pyruvate,water dikinase